MAWIAAEANTKLYAVRILEEAITHKSAKTHAGNVFVTHDLDLLTQNQRFLRYRA